MAYVYLDVTSSEWKSGEFPHDDPFAKSHFRRCCGPDSDRLPREDRLRTLRHVFTSTYRRKYATLADDGSGLGLGVSGIRPPWFRVAQQFN